MPGFIVTAVGSARIQGDVSSARMEAENEARRRLAAFLKTKIYSIAKNLDRQAGDLLRPSSLTSLVENETITLEVVQATLVGTVPLEYYTDWENDTVYVLMGLASQKFIQSFRHLVERHLDEMLPKREGAKLQDLDKMKERARKKLDQLLNQEVKRHEKS